jgi:hypothetical protein
MDWRLLIFQALIAQPGQVVLVEFDHPTLMMTT